MSTSYRAVLQRVRTFPKLIAFLRDEMGWPIESDDFEDLTYDYTPGELGIDPASAAKIVGIKRLRPLVADQPWGIFFVEFEPKRLPVVALRRILSGVVLRRRASANKADRMAWETDDLLFVSNYGDGDERQISFAHFSQDNPGSLPTLRVLGWDNLDTPLHLDRVAEVLTRKLVWPSDDTDPEKWRDTWRSAFTLRHRETITTSRELSMRLAELARAIRDRIGTALTIESENGPLTKLMGAFREALVHDLDADGFADMYAQTIAYGLLSARIADPKSKTTDDLAAHMRTNPLLRELMATFLNAGGEANTPQGRRIDFDELGVSEVVDLLDAANMEAVVDDFGDRNPQEDPVIHFYELFLKEYDPKEKLKRGVFYTPRPVVSYIVRSVDELLRTEFGLEDGLADTATWGEMAKRHRDLATPEDASADETFVQVLDPACGTGTFLVEVIDLIHNTLVAKWRVQNLGENEIEAHWNDYVPRHLLPRLHGYELLMAPYAIAHLKIGLKLYETGYRFGGDERARVFLTDALEPARDFSGRFEFAISALAHEAQAVNAVKRVRRFTVVVGNPPYAGHSANTGEWISSLVADYYRVGGEPLGERTAKWLQDDYVKFIRFGQKLIDSASVGILGYVTNHGYLDSPTFRGMRASLLEQFDGLHLLDLHGNLKKRERSPSGGKDENVFDIQTGVAVSLMTKCPRPGGCVSHAGIFGLRQDKYQELLESSRATTEWQAFEPVPPFFLLHPQDVDLFEEFMCGWKTTEVFPVNGVGMTTARDNVVIDFEREPLVQRAAVFRDSEASDAELCEQLQMPQKKGWGIGAARRLLKSEANLGQHIQGVAYRPFDDRLIFYHDSLVWRTVRTVMRHMLAGDNVGLAVGRAGQVIDQGEWNLAYATTRITEFNLFRRGGNNLAPLYTYPDLGALDSEASRSPNLSPAFLRQLSARLSLEQARPFGLPRDVCAEDIFHYAYAVLFSRGYRSRYAEFLKIDFPRLPLPGGVSLFRDVAALGGQLVDLHVLESPTLNDFITTYVGPENPEVARVSWLEDTVWLDAASTKKGRPAAPGTIGFRGVLEAVWDFHIGGYQVCEKWLKDRKGRTLSNNEVGHYQEIVVALSETIRLMQEIDGVIDAHGGWPAAFQTTAPQR